MTKCRRFASCFLLIAICVPAGAFAAGPVVGTNCTAAWLAVTTNTDGSPVIPPITYNLYVAPGTPTTLPTTPTIAGISSLSAKACSVLAPGQYTLWVTAVEQLSGSSSESAKSAPFPFVLGAPAAPGGVSVQ